MRRKAVKEGDVAGVQQEWHGPRFVHHAGRQRVGGLAGRSQQSVAVVTGKDLGATVVLFGGVQRDQHRQETAREAGPRGVVLVQVVAFHSRRLVDQLVLKQARLFAVQRTDRGQQARVQGQPVTAQRQVDHRVEALEQVFAGDDVRHEPRAEVLRIDDGAVPFQELLRLRDDRSNLAFREEAAEDQHTIVAPGAQLAFA